MGKERIRLLSVNEDIRSMYRDLQLSDLANKTNLEQSLKNAQKELYNLFFSSLMCNRKIGKS